MTFAFGQSEHERIAIDVVNYKRPTSGDYDDDNWVVTQIEVHVGGFKGKARASLRTTELIEFGSQLRPLYETLSGTAEFTTLEGPVTSAHKRRRQGTHPLKGRDDGPSWSWQSTTFQSRIRSITASNLCTGSGCGHLEISGSQSLANTAGRLVSASR
jgi:hypothetical protein